MLEADYRRGLALTGRGQRALRVAFSLYNTGDPRRGFANGYVARVTGAPPPAPKIARQEHSVTPSRAPAWDVFAAAQAPGPHPSFVFALTGGPQ